MRVLDWKQYMISSGGKCLEALGGCLEVDMVNKYNSLSRLHIGAVWREAYRGFPTLMGS